MADRQTISCVTIVYNEEHNIRECLETATWMDEIIVVDSFSTDETKEIAQLYTKNIYQRSWNGFGRQKNFAIEKVTSAWVFILDADERISSELREEIEILLSSANSASSIAYAVPRRNMLYGQWVRWGGAYPDYQIRLFRTGTAKYNQVEIHENLLISGSVGTLQSHLTHFTENRISDHFKKIGYYTSLAAKEKQKVRATVYWYHLVVNPFVVFLKTYLFKKGFKDGIRGVIFAVHAGMYTFLKYAKLWNNLNRIQDP